MEAVKWTYFIENVLPLNAPCHPAFPWSLGSGSIVLLKQLLAGARVIASPDGL